MRKMTFIISAIVINSTVLAECVIPTGTYIELYLGAKSGGGKEHHILVEKLKNDDDLQGF
jgi:hypothetical protein